MRTGIAPQEALMHDLVIRGATVVDGTGAPAFVGDRAVDGGRISAIGRVDGDGREEIDATGRLVTPGFVDVHTHYDGQVTWDPLLLPSSWHGVTTVVMGNCGVGFAPVRPSDHQRLIELMEGVEDIPGAALHEGLSWDWQSFPEYLDALERLPHDIDFAAQVPHGAVRVYVMGERGATGKPATSDDIARMAQLTRQAIEAGALGFSTTRLPNHRSSNGAPAPSYTATETELRGIATALRDAGRGVIQLVSDFENLDTEWQVLAGMAEASGRPLSVSVLEHFVMEVTDSSTTGAQVLERISVARADGLAITAQV